MKKAIAITLTFLAAVLFLTACGNKKDEETTDPADIQVIDLTTSEPEEEPTYSNSAGDKNPNQKVDISIPLEMIDEKYRNDLDAYAKAKGYISATLEKDGTVTLKMTAMTLDLLKTQAGLKIMREMGAMVDSGDFPYAVKLEQYNDDFSYIVMLVKGAEYKKAGSPADLADGIGQCGLYYQIFTDSGEMNCRVILADSQTGEVLFNKLYTNEPESEEPSQTTAEAKAEN
ncbi:MAG: hypothetical protein PUC33_03250 [Oscillospiraceae bacterium]|nr:hypothetical protein [Oscillospiraceae bacterium]MDD6145614.1 hypothetical protein [Oscillospiraceae bacterium]